jgi:hypothetical protein
MNCPQCRQPIVADVQQLFDVGANPQDKQIFLSGAFNIAQCPHCGYQGMLATPLVYHDPEKELLLTYFPPELHMTVQEQEKVVGPLIKRVMDALPQEKRKGYLFNPRPMLTLQGMLETILEADGITKEMIQSQQERINLIEKLLTAPGEEARLKILQENEALFDEEFFALFGSIAQSAIYSGNEEVARQMVDLQNLLLEHTPQGREIKEESDEIQAALQALRDLGENITRESLLDLVVNAPTEARLRAFVQFIRPGMDYEFFALFSQRIENASGEERTRLEQKRDALLTFTQEYDDEQAARVQAARKNVDLLLQAPDLEVAVRQNINAIDETFIQALTLELELARKEGNLDRSARLQQLMNAIETASAPPPEIMFAEQLLSVADDEDALMQMLADNDALVTPDLTQVLASLIAQGQAVVQETSGTEQAQHDATLARLQKVYEAVLHYSMKKSFTGTM